MKHLFVTRLDAGYAALLLFLIAAVYWPGLSGGFILDDGPNIVSNTALHVALRDGWDEWLSAALSSKSGLFQRPIAMLSFAFNHALTGLSPYWMKLTNLGIHLVNSVLVYGLTKLIFTHTKADQSHFTPSIIALWVAAAWALSPINLTSVLYIVQRMESLCHTVVLAALWLYTRERKRSMTDESHLIWAACTIALGLATGMLIKESAVLLPLYALTLEWTIFGFQSKSRARDRRIVVPYALLGLPALLGLAWLAPSIVSGEAFAARDFTLPERLLTELRVVAEYMTWIVLPRLGELSLFHDNIQISTSLLSPPSTLISAMALFTLAAFAIHLRRRRPIMALGIALFFGAHTLTATIIPLEIVHEHRNYFASFGLIMAIADALILIAAKLESRRTTAIAALALLCLYTATTAARVQEWSNPLRLAHAESARNPDSARATYNLGRTLLVLSKYRPESPYTPLAFSALNEAMTAKGASSLPEAAALVLAARTGNEADANWWGTMQYKLRTRPVSYPELASLEFLVGCEIEGSCKFPEAEMRNSFSAALSTGSNAALLAIYGNYTLNVLEDPQQTLELWRLAAQIQPNEPQHQISLARLLTAMGEEGEAKPHIDALRRIGRFRQYEPVARELERLQSAERKKLN